MSTLVTGIPGSGKTTLVNHARSMGDDSFFDADTIAGLCEWREFETGKVFGLVTDYPQQAQDEWHVKYGCYWKFDVLRQFIADKPEAVICGSCENVVDSFKYFDNIILLKKTQEELLSNLLNPQRSNPFGKTPKQRKTFLKWQEYLLKEARKYNAIVIDGNDIAKTYVLVKQNKA